MEKPSLIQEALKKPFPRGDIEFRVGRVSAKNRKANVLAYITARGIMNRLDGVFGIEGWKDEYEVLATGVKCRLSVKIGKDWVTKADVAPFTNIEALKGAFSDSLKRAGVKFGIGRYLYDLPEHWVEIQSERPRDAALPVHYISSDSVTGWWEEPQLPEWALPDPVRPAAGAVDPAGRTEGSNLVPRPNTHRSFNALSSPGLSYQKRFMGSSCLDQTLVQKFAHNRISRWKRRRNIFSILTAARTNRESEG